MVDKALEEASSFMSNHIQKKKFDSIRDFGRSYDTFEALSGVPDEDVPVEGMYGNYPVVITRPSMMNVARTMPIGTEIRYKETTEEEVD